MQAASSAFAIKRINKDLKEIQQNPLEGVGICLLDEKDPFKLLVNIRVMEGRYRDLIFHMILVLPEQYPCKPPRMFIFPGQPYNNSFHHHLYDAYGEYEGYHRFCIDLLDAALMDANTVGSGWSPGYTFCTLLMQIQNFLADPDFHSKSEELSDQQINEVHSQVNKFSYSHTVGDKTFVHSTQNPYPPLHEKKEEAQQMVDPNLFELNMIKNRISCFMTTENFVDEKQGIYGYPIYVQKDKFNRLQQKPVPEILSYEGFKSQLNQTNQSHKTVNFKAQFKTGMGEAYNAFLPIFLNQEHYTLSKEVLVDSLASISDAKTFELQILQVLPNLINKMLVALLNDSMHQSISAIEAYIHFTQLFHQLVKERSILRQEVNLRVQNMIRDDYSRSKQSLGDIGEFLVVLIASDYALTPELLNILYREYFARQIFWITKNNTCFSGYNSAKNTPDKLKNIFEASSVSNKLLIFNIEAAKKFALNDEYLKKLAVERYSVIPETEAEKFIKGTKEVTKNIDSHIKLMNYLGLKDVYPNDEDCFNLFKIAIYVSNLQKYTNFTLQLQNGKSNPQQLQIKGSWDQPKVKELILKQANKNTI